MFLKAEEDCRADLECSEVMEDHTFILNAEIQYLYSIKSYLTEE